MPLFCSFFATDRLILDDEPLEKYCRDVKSKSPGRKVSNKGGWQSNIIREIDEDLKDLYTAVMERAEAINRHIGHGGPTVRMQAFWININEKNDHNEAHDHPKAFYSAVYYVKARENQGKLKFLHPIAFYSNYAMMNNVEEFTFFNSVMFEHTPMTGDLVFFPSYLTHFVESNNTDEERISIAFNFGIDWSDFEEGNGY